MTQIVYSLFGDNNVVHCHLCRKETLPKPFEQEKYYYKAVKVDNFHSSNYIWYECNSDRAKLYQSKNILMKSNHD